MVWRLDGKIRHEYLVIGWTTDKDGEFVPVVAEESSGVTWTIEDRNVLNDVHYSISPIAQYLVDPIEDDSSEHLSHWLDDMDGERRSREDIPFPFPAPTVIRAEHSPTVELSQTDPSTTKEIR